jgi:hypothetical protein
MLNVTKRYQAPILMVLGVLGVAYAPLVLAEELNLTPTTVSSADSDQGVGVSTSIRFNNENWFTSPHPEPATLVVTSTGEMYGTTTSGIPFKQINIENTTGIRIQEFFIQDHRHYIVEGEEVYTVDELSKKIGLLYQVQ